MKPKKKKEMPEFETIEAAIGGDAEAISECKREYQDEFGRIRCVADEYMKRRMETKLITKILDFKIML